MTDASRVSHVGFASRVANVPADGPPVGVTITITLGIGVEPFGMTPFGGGAPITIPPTTRGFRVTFSARSANVQANSRRFPVAHESRTLGA